MISVGFEEWTIEDARESADDGDEVAIRYRSVEFDHDNVNEKGEPTANEVAWDADISLEELRTLVEAGRAFLRLLDKLP